MPTIVLFDIDGTLIRTGRAGSRAMNRAFEDLFGIPQAFDGIQMAGRTDKWILEDAAARAGVSLSETNFQRFRSRYFERLLEALAEPGPRSRGPQRGSRARAPTARTLRGGVAVGVAKGVLPGVQPLLDALASRSDVFLALLTGNCEEGARIKLEHFDLWRFFRCGAFGDDAHDRNELFAVAIQRAEADGAPPVTPQNVIVVGDTVLDVACAMAAGARSVAVATGPSDSKALRQSGADVVVEDLRDTGAFLQLL